VAATAALLSIIARLYPSDFEFRPPPYEYESIKMPFDILAGDSSLREQISAGTFTGETAAGWAESYASFLATCKELRHYGERP
jgi:uncharacterized protein YbbC (DUF1343 family)